jgi:hypothetical protein
VLHIFESRRDYTLLTVEDGEHAQTTETLFRLNINYNGVIKIRKNESIFVINYWWLEFCADASYLRERQTISI